MAGKFSFQMQSGDHSRRLPHKLIIGQQETETATHIILKLTGFLLFFRERLQMEANLHLAHIPFVPDLVELDYELRPKLWVECGECNVNKLNKLAVKVPEAEIWVVRPSAAAAEELLRAMSKEKLRRNRYHVLALDQEMVEEMARLLKSRNDLFWFKGSFSPPAMQFEFNQLWFDVTFTHELF